MSDGPNNPGFFGRSTREFQGTDPQKFFEQLNASGEFLRNSDLIGVAIGRETSLSPRFRDSDGVKAFKEFLTDRLAESPENLRVVHFDLAERSEGDHNPIFIVWIRDEQGISAQAHSIGDLDPTVVRSKTIPYLQAVSRFTTKTLNITDGSGLNIIEYLNQKGISNRRPLGMRTPRTDRSARDSLTNAVLAMRIVLSGQGVAIQKELHKLGRTIPKAIYNIHDQPPHLLFEDLHWDSHLDKNALQGIELKIQTGTETAYYVPTAIRTCLQLLMGELKEKAASKALIRSEVDNGYLRISFAHNGKSLNLPSRITDHFGLSGLLMWPPYVFDQKREHLYPLYFFYQVAKQYPGATLSVQIRGFSFPEKAPDGWTGSSIATISSYGGISAHEVAKPMPEGVFEIVTLSLPVNQLESYV